MFDWLFVKEPSYTEKEIARLYKERASYEPTSKEYYELNCRLKELLELKELEKKPKIQPPSTDTILKVGAMVVVCGIIVFKEELVGPVTSKALSLMTKIA